MFEAATSGETALPQFCGVVAADGSNMLVHVIFLLCNLVWCAIYDASSHALPDKQLRDRFMRIVVNPVAYPAGRQVCASSLHITLV